MTRRIGVWNLYKIPYLSRSVGGVVVNIVAFQAIVPGSIPGRRRILYIFEPALIPYDFDLLVSLESLVSKF